MIERRIFIFHLGVTGQPEKSVIRDMKKRRTKRRGKWDIGPVVLDKEWKQYTIDLKGKDLSYIIGGFAWATNLDVDPDGCVFYLDEIKYE